VIKPEKVANQQKKNQSASGKLGFEPSLGQKLFGLMEGGNLKRRSAKSMEKNTSQNSK